MNVGCVERPNTEIDKFSNYLILTDVDRDTIAAYILYLEQQCGKLQI